MSCDSDCSLDKESLQDGLISLTILADDFSGDQFLATEATLVITVTDGTEAASFDFSVGAHSCYATHVDTDGQESFASNTVDFVITPAKPNPPTLSIN